MSDAASGLTELLKRTGLLSQVAGAGVPIGTAAPNPQPGMSMANANPGMIAAPIGTPQTQRDQSRVNDLQTQGSGISQLQHSHPIWGGILKALDIAGSVLTPGLAQAIPGTTLHHQQLLGEAQGNLKADIGNQENLAQTDEAMSKAEASRRQLLAPVPKTPTNALELYLQDPEKANAFMSAEAAAKAAANPKPDKADKTQLFTDANGVPHVIDMETKQGTAVSEGGNPLKGPTKPASETSAADDQKYEKIQQNLILKKPVTAEDRAFAKAHEKLKTLNAVTTNNLITQREATNAERKGDAATRTGTFKAYQPALDSAERFNIMTDNFTKAVKGDQQAMVSLLMNHIGMTLGAQKGARITKDVIHEAQQSSPWLQNAKARFGPDGVLSGVVLPPDTMKKMVDLGRERFSEDVSKARSQAQYLGAEDDGPARIPNHATATFYLHAANGDKAKAKQLAAADGFTVK